MGRQLFGWPRSGRSAPQGLSIAEALVAPHLNATCLPETRTALLGMLCKSRYVRLDEPGEVGIA